MKRAGRWLFNFAAVVSLVLCVATAALCTRGLIYNDAWYDLTHDQVPGEIPVVVGNVVVMNRLGI